MAHHHHKPPSRGTESPSGTAVTTVGPTINASPTPGSAGSGNIFSISSGATILYDGVLLGGAAVTELYYINTGAVSPATNHTCYQLGSGTWWGPVTATSLGSSVPDPRPTIVSGITLSNSGFPGGSASGTVVGTITVSVSQGPAYAGAVTITGTNAADFQISGSNLETQGVVANGSYSINLVAGGVSVPFTITASTSSPIPLGIYAGVDPTDTADFTNTWNGFVSLCGPLKFVITYSAASAAPSTWGSTASYIISTWTAQTYMTPAKIIPQHGLCMGSSASGQPAQDAFFKAITAGTYDSDYQAVLAAYNSAGYKTVHFRPGWEMNISGSPWGPVNTPTLATDFAAAFAHIYTLVHTYASANGMTVKVSWCPAIEQGTVTTAYLSYYPGDAFCDQIGIDIYGIVYSSLGNVPTDPTVSANQYNTTAAVNLAIARGKSLAIGETGGVQYATGAKSSFSQATFIQQLATMCAKVTTDYVCWFEPDNDGLNNDLNFTYGTNPNGSQTTVAAAVNTYFGYGA